MAKRRKSKCTIKGPFKSKRAAQRHVPKTQRGKRKKFVVRRDAYYVMSCPKN